MNNRTFAFLALAATGLTAQSALLWDNNVIPNGVGARALSPPAFPNIRVVDDIVVRAPGWAVDTIRMFVIEVRPGSREVRLTSTSTPTMTAFQAACTDT